MRQGVFSENGNWEKTAWIISDLLQSYHQIIQEEEMDSPDRTRLSQAKRARTAYNKYFSHYPDIVNIQQFAKMADVGKVLARKIAKEGYVQSIFHVVKGWQFPKRWVIDYLLSDHYIELMKTLNRNRRGR